MEGVSTKDVVTWGLLLVGAYVLYRLIGVGAGVASAVGTGINAASAGIANLWVSLTTAAPLNLTGNVQFPDGSQVPQGNLPFKTDAQGNLFTYSNGITYQLQPWILDSTGKAVYPVVPVGT